MLEGIPSDRRTFHVFRLDFAGKISRLPEAHDFDAMNVQELRELLRPFTTDDRILELCDAPFKPKPKRHGLYGNGRFSNGSFPVFYSSLEPETAEAEIQHWLPARLGNPKRSRTVHYGRIRCSFKGVLKDLKFMQDRWPELTHDSDYGFCNKLGAEAVNRKLDAFLTPSARRENGTNVPIFTRESISDPRLIGCISMTYDPISGCVTIDST